MPDWIRSCSVNGGRSIPADGVVDDWSGGGGSEAIDDVDGIGAFSDDDDELDLRW